MLTKLKIVFTKTNRTVEAPINIRNRAIPYSPSVEYLGLTLDSKLTFTQHITKTVNKDYGALRRPIVYPLFKYYTLTNRINVILGIHMSIIRSMLL